MALSLPPPLLSFLLFHAILFLFNPVHCDDDQERKLFQSINSYRQSKNLPAFTRNENAACFAGEIADSLQDQNRPCKITGPSTTVSGGAHPQVADYPSILQGCNVRIKTTTDGIILPACVPKLAPAEVVTNFTRSRYSRYLNDSRFTIAGVGSKQDWIVVVLSTNSRAGRFSRADNLVSKIALSHCLMVLLSGLFLILLCVES